MPCLLAPDNGTADPAQAPRRGPPHYWRSVPPSLKAGSRSLADGPSDKRPSCVKSSKARKAATRGLTPVENRGHRPAARHRPGNADQRAEPLKLTQRVRSGGFALTTPRGRPGVDDTQGDQRDCRGGVEAGVDRPQPVDDGVVEGRQRRDRKPGAHGGQMWIRVVVVGN